ncbi:MFS transporter [Streptomyces tsukubensis]|uniref:MFS transporter n=1 Tax=Streptomyces tsukubensis (strain DSM 42081 / NBRC 108919 / NRRL 18488 / 9993) TaxID=1114943 RepID=A0A7G3UD20_STRT9|nr:MFS transporter [Streptomyces tsukubensis]AZK95666.1 MFS transporter [Streptomyces tsukubensis]QKM68303.1 MFS transporter [Streptomyces tsukubensis NRRL18488]TAI43120.1 MFS transporter [Streptomyces tsukubensis]
MRAGTAGKGAGRRAPLTRHQLLLLGASFLITVGSFAVLPYMSVLLHGRWGLGLGTVGAVLAAASLIQFGGGVFGAALARRIGLRATMLTALTVRTAGFACFAPGGGGPVLAVVALLLVSAGAALYLPANKAYLVAGRPEEERPRLLALSGSAFTTGVALGPVAAAPFVLSEPTALFGAVALLFAAVCGAHALLPPVQDGDRTSRTGRTGRTDRGTGVRGRPPREPFAPAERAPFAYALLSVYVFMYFQHYLALYAIPRMSAASYGFLLMAYALLLAVLQPLLARWTAELPYGRALRLGFGAMALGTAGLATGGPVGIAAGAALMCWAEAVLFLRNELEALAGSAAPAATVFGRQRLAAGFGAAAAALFGGPLYGAAERAGDTGLFWLAVAAQSLLLPVAGWAVGRARRDQAAARTTAPAAVPAPGSGPASASPSGSGSGSGS